LVIVASTWAASLALNIIQQLLIITALKLRGLGIKNYTALPPLITTWESSGLQQIIPQRFGGNIPLGVFAPSMIK
jgi:hypothetical protein